MGVYPGDLNFPQQVTLTITPMVMGVISFLGSGTILYTFLRDYKRKMSSIKYRLLAAICLSDLVNSAVYFIWILPIPPENPGIPGGVTLWGAIGNTATCDVQGFLAHIGNIGAHYNGALAFYFLLALKYRMTDQAIAQRCEIWMHLWGLLWPVSTGIAAWVMNLFNFGAHGCWIAPYPYRCNMNDDLPCTRGERALLFAWLFTGIPLLITCGVILYSMFMTYRSVKETYERAHRLHRAVSCGFLASPDVTNASGRFADRIQQAGIQSILYSTAYIGTHCWAVIIGFVDLAGGTLYFWIIFLQLLSWPTQGFWNVFIFLRPTIQKIQRQDPRVSYLKAAFLAAFREEEPGRLSLTYEQPSVRRPVSSYLSAFFRSPSNLSGPMRLAVEGVAKLQGEEKSQDSIDCFGGDPIEEKEEEERGNSNCHSDETPTHQEVGERMSKNGDVDNTMIDDTTVYDGDKETIHDIVVEHGGNTTVDDTIAAKDNRSVKDDISVGN